MLNIMYRDRKTNEMTGLTSQKTEVDLGRREYEIIEGHCVSPPRSHTKGKDLEEYWRDSGETD